MARKILTMFVCVFPLFLLIPVVVAASSDKGGSQIRASAIPEDYDYSDYQSDIHVDPQFPVYSNWQRAEDTGQFRINSPRKNEEEEENNNNNNKGDEGVGDSKDGKNKGDAGYISVKLPDDIYQHFGKRYGLGGGDPISNILGIPADSISSLGGDEAPRPAPRPTSPPRTTSTSTARPDKSKHILDDYQDHFRAQDNEDSIENSRTREHEYYNKKDLLPKLSKNNDKPASTDLVGGRTGGRSLWSVAWQAHIYFAGALFVLLALYCSVNVCRLHLFSRLFSRGFFLSLNLCMIVVGLSRGVFLLYDAYNEGGGLYYPLAYVLLNIGYPAVTSAFAILFLALLRVTQVELLSPSVQTPTALAIFCGVHVAVSVALDITVGLVAKLQYLLLLGQGIFIVWSLLLSAGYFYIYSTLKKVVSRQQCELNRAVYPKLMYDQTGSGTYSMRLPAGHSNPLARAVNLTLGVAVLGSLIGGVQLYGMIGMHGLLRTDPSEIPDPWYGYQVALRVLEILICYLLAVVATTPLRQDGGSARAGQRGGPCSSCSPLLCCNGEGSCQKCGENPPTHLDEEIYTEICTNNHAVRVLNPVDGYNPNMTGLTLVNQSQLSQMSQNPHCTATLALSTSGQHLTTGGQHLSNTLARRRQQVQNGGPAASGGTAAAVVPRNSQLSGDSGATMDTALYSNLRSRPSSMLFNDAGFVRFRLGNDPSLGQTEVLRQSTQDLVNGEGEEGTQPSAKQPSLRESLRGSRSFDEGILSEIKKNFSDNNKVPLERPQSNLSYSAAAAGRGDQGGGESRQIKSELCSPDVEGLPGLPQRPASKLTTHNINRVASPVFNRNGSDTEAGEEQYEAPAGLILTQQTKSLAAQVRSVVGYSESDLSSLDPVYAAGKSVYGYSRAPSRCSSISATQSFDMRVYGRAGPSGSATLGRPVPKPKLENKFYYYGSTRGQKNKSSQREAVKESLTPRPLLPSQRTLGGDTRLGPSPQPPKVPNGVHSNPSQSLYDQIMGNQRELASPTSLALQRSRSLGRDSAPPGRGNLPPRAPGPPRTPTSVARKVLESVTKRRGGKDKVRGRPPHDPQRQGLLGPGQLVQTADGRLVALGPGNTLVEVGTLVDPRRARQISQDREEMLYGPAVQQSQPQVYGRLPFGASRPPAAAELRGVAGTPPAARAVHADPRWAPQSFGQPYNTTQFSDQPFIEQAYSIEDQQYKQQQQEYREGQQHYYREDPRYQEDLYSDQYGMEVQAARLAGNLASPPWHGAARRRDDDLRNREDDIKAREDDIRSREDDLESDNTQHMGLESELDSEISSLFSYNDHPQRGVKNLHLVSPLEYAALLKQQYSDPPGLLGKDITPDSGVVVDSRNHSKERDARTRRDNFRTGGGSRNSRNCEQLGDQLDQLRTASSQLEQLGQLRTASSSGDEEESSSERESGMKGGRQYSQVPQSEPSQPEKKEVDRVRKSSEQSNVTDSDAGDQASYEYSADSLLSDSDKESPAGGSDPPVSEKLSTVCNEIKARFLND